MKNCCQSQRVDQLKIKDKHLRGELDHLRKAGTRKLYGVHWRHLRRHVKLSRQVIPLNYLLLLVRVKTLIVALNVSKGVGILGNKMLTFLNRSIADIANALLKALWMLLMNLAIIIIFKLVLLGLLRMG